MSEQFHGLFRSKGLVQVVDIDQLVIVSVMGTNAAFPPYEFVDDNGNCRREDILQVMNRLSSMLYILMIRLKADR